MEELMAVLLGRVFMSIFVSGTITLVICFVMNHVVLPFTSYKGAEKAKAAGRMINAVRVGTIIPRGIDIGEQGVQSMHVGIYEYWYNGIKYTYKGSFYYSPPTDLELYFRKVPSKARMEQEYGRLESEWKPLFAILAVVCFLGTFFVF